MGLGLLLVPALAGYLFLNWFNATRYSLPRETGYHVVFQSAIAGVVLFVIARLLVVLANAVTPAIAECWNTIVQPRGGSQCPRNIRSGTVWSAKPSAVPSRLRLTVSSPLRRHPRQQCYCPASLDR